MTPDREKLWIRVQALEQTVDSLQEELIALNLALDQKELVIRELKDSVAEAQQEADALQLALDIEQEHLAEVMVPREHECRTCRQTFWAPGDAQWCSDDCRYWRKAMPFKEYYASLHHG